MSTLHIMYQGNSEDLSLEDMVSAGDRETMGIPEGAEMKDLTGDQIKNILANHYDQPLEEFNELSVEWHKNGNVTVRPQATFGTT